MLTTVAVPPLGERKQTETLLNFWYVDEGQEVEAGEDLAELVTDKAAFNLPAPSAGKVKRILVQEGAKVKEGDALVELDVAG
ncbi:MAG: lipoyl domain-containing protein [Planctomycetota bacterium]|nr:lipoyl domain-containing protein [Planctomycetota bacterium]